MSQSVKSSLIACAVIVSLTICKFILYWVSGSIAVLSEAWHSTSDIATTVLVLFAILRQERKDSSVHQSKGTPAADAPGEKPGRKRFAFIKRSYLWLRSINSQLKISFLIGVVLLVAAATLLWQGATVKAQVVEAPLVTGLIFIGLSFGSFFLYRFEEHMGREEQSAALIADSHHNRADMAISLLTGASLILYYFGYNLDRWTGIFIASYILVFSIELLFNTLKAISSGSDKLAFNYKFTAIVWRLFQLSTYKKLYNLLETKAALGSRRKKVLLVLPKILQWISRWTVRFAVSAGIIFYLSTIFYTVESDEKALHFRFGRLVNTTETVQPGLHLKFPYPIDSVAKVKTKQIRALEVGNSMSKDTTMIWTLDHGDDQAFISGDNNLFLPYIVLHYSIKDLHNYYLNFGEGVAEKVLTSICQSLLNHIFTTNSFFDLLLEKRQSWTNEFKILLQKELDARETGIEIIDFCLRDMHPPTELAGAYEEVVAATQLKEAELNDARRKVNSYLARERMQKLTTVAEAQSYILQKIKSAEGETKNYLLRYSGYMEGGDVMKEILFLDAAQKALSGKKLFLVEPGSGIENKLIYIENHMTGARK